MAVPSEAGPEGCLPRLQDHQHPEGRLSRMSHQEAPRPAGRLRSPSLGSFMGVCARRQGRLSRWPMTGLVQVFGGDRGRAAEARSRSGRRRCWPCGAGGDRPPPLPKAQLPLADEGVGDGDALEGVEALQGLTVQDDDALRAG